MTTHTKKLISCGPYQPDSKVVVLRMTHEEVALIDKYAAMEKRSRSSFMRVLIAQGLEQYKNKAGEPTVTD